MKKNKKVQDSVNLGHPSFYYPERVFNLKLRWNWWNQQPPADKSVLVMKFKSDCAKTAKCVKGYGTGYSQAVTHPSTNPACGCLTSEIERDRVHSTEYGRIQQTRKKHPYKCTVPWLWPWNGWRGSNASEMLQKLNSRKARRCWHFVL